MLSNFLSPHYSPSITVKGKVAGYGGQLPVCRMSSHCHHRSSWGGREGGKCRGLNTLLIVENLEYYEMSQMALDLERTFGTTSAV